MNKKFSLFKKAAYIATSFALITTGCIFGSNEVNDSYIGRDNIQKKTTNYHHHYYPSQSSEERRNIVEDSDIGGNNTQRGKNGNIVRKSRIGGNNVQEN